MGDIEAMMVGSEVDYSYDVSCDLGSVNIGNYKTAGLSDDYSFSGGMKKISVSCDAGDIDIKMEVEVTSDDNEHMRIRLIIHIFDEAIKNRYPFEMKVVVVGYFSIGVEKDNDIAHYQANAIAILYPYIRAIVSTYTASANVTPLILPTVNVNKFLKNRTANS